jgi:hypothetical protein
MPDVGAVPGINWTQVTPEERKKLQGLIEHYRKKPHPFTACVRDNTKRFGHERATRICAVLKDLIHGGTGWRKGGKRKMTEAADVLTAEETRALIEQAEAIIEESDKLRRMEEREYARFDPRLHPRHARGTSQGGKFAKKLALLKEADKQRASSDPRNDISVRVDDKPLAAELVKSGDLRAVEKANVKTGVVQQKTYEITGKGQKTKVMMAREARGADARERGVEGETPGRAAKPASLKPGDEILEYKGSSFDVNEQAPPLVVDRIEGGRVYLRTRGGRAAGSIPANRGYVHLLKRRT